MLCRRRKHAFGYVARQPVQLDHLVTRSRPVNQREVAPRNVECAGQEPEHGLVRLPCLGWSRDANFPGIAVAPDDPSSRCTGNDAQSQTRARASHDPKDIRGLRLARDLPDPAVLDLTDLGSGRGRVALALGLLLSGPLAE